MAREKVKLSQCPGQAGSAESKSMHKALEMSTAWKMEKRLFYRVNIYF